MMTTHYALQPLSTMRSREKVSITPGKSVEANRCVCCDFDCINKLYFSLTIGSIGSTLKISIKKTIL